MKAINRSMALLGSLMLAAMLTLSACAGTSTSRSTGDVVDDSVLVTKVNAAIAEESISQAWDVEVEAYRGVVQLSGFVDTEAEIQTIVDIAQGVDGVREVENSLQVKPAS